MNQILFSMETNPTLYGCMPIIFFYIFSASSPEINFMQRNIANITGLSSLFVSSVETAFASTVSPNSWISLCGSYCSMQSLCNREGFNIRIPGRVKARIGIIGNDQNDCMTPDSIIGLGIGSWGASHTQFFNISAGADNYCNCGGHRGFRPNIPAWSFIYGRDFSNCSSLNYCSARGRCVANNFCTCDANYLGTTCAQTTCFGTLSNQSSVCSSNGACVDYNSCSCVRGSSGLSCNVTWTCFSASSLSTSGCSNRGFCDAPDTCTCNANYLGAACNVTTCSNVLSNSSMVCSSHGACNSYNNCTCSINYDGNNCQFTTCFGTNSSVPAVCNGHGSCAAFDTCTMNFIILTIVRSLQCWMDRSSMSICILLWN